jgi:predicted transcriptional regulator
MDLRQPETSKALSTLLLLKWVKTEAMQRKEGQIGKSTILYRLIPLDKLYAEIEEKEIASLRKKEAALEKLKSAMIPPKSPGADEHARLTEQPG